MPINFYCAIIISYCLLIIHINERSNRRLRHLFLPPHQFGILYKPNHFLVLNCILVLRTLFLLELRLSHLPELSPDEVLVGIPLLKRLG